LFGRAIASADCAATGVEMAAAINNATREEATERAGDMIEGVRSLSEYTAHPGVGDPTEILPLDAYFPSDHL
jgi:hypothetical protein